MPIEEQLEAIFEVLEGGVETTAEVIQFPTDVAGAGATLEGTTSEVMLGNGVATEVSQLTAVEGGVTETAGVGLLAMDVGAVGLAIAPALGIIAGVGLYNLAPEFWTNVSNELVRQGQTIGGKVRAFINGDLKQVGFSSTTIEIFKNAFIQAGLFQQDYNVSEDVAESLNITTPMFSTPKQLMTTAGTGTSLGTYNGKNIVLRNTSSPYTNAIVNVAHVPCTISGLRYDVLMFASKEYVRPFGIYEPLSAGYITSAIRLDSFTYLGKTVYYNAWDWSSYDLSHSDFNFDSCGLQAVASATEKANIMKHIAWSLMYGLKENPNLQPNAKYPTTDPFPKTYPTWTPWSVPVEGFPDVYPVEVPAINPDPDQQQAQFPQEIPDNDPNALDWLIETLPQPDPNPNPYPEPAPNPDPDPQPEPEPIPDPEPEPTPENPVDPNPDPTPSPLPVVPVMPDTVPANAMFTVYAPTISQVNSFGGWLWDSNILEQIKRIWQDPLNGIISFMKVYATPTTGGSDTIKVGVLDSNVPSAVVTRQFVTIECGSINISEKFYNATDYTPFVSLHLYLPFIGIVELDVDEFMNGTITVTYHVDVYTGTCLAEVKSTRSPDMPNPTIVYTFSGNASQQLPLTSAEFSGALSSLVSAVGGGLAIASGGGLGLLAGATGIAHAVTHEMVHVAHSGSLSANAGIMGSRTPFIIITRHRPYDANGYNTIWGYPSNKTVYLNNCSGFVRVKDMQLKTGATRGENDEIMELLRNGVII